MRDAQNFALRLGVGHVDYAGRVEIANICNHALWVACQRGVPMPSGFFIKERFTRDENEDPNDYGYYLAGTGDAPGEIYVNAGRKVWTNIVEAMREGRRHNFFSTADPRHIPMHEIGELAMHQSVGGDRYYPFGEEYLRDEREFRRLDLDRIRRLVSERAVAGHSEFVAEVFAGRVLGRDELREDELVGTAFERFGGTRIVQRTRP